MKSVEIKGTVVTSISLPHENSQLCTNCPFLEKNNYGNPDYCKLYKCELIIYQKILPNQEQLSAKDRIFAEHDTLWSFSVRCNECKRDFWETSDAVSKDEIFKRLKNGSVDELISTTATAIREIFAAAGAASKLVEIGYNQIIDGGEDAHE